MVRMEAVEQFIAALNPEFVTNEVLAVLEGLGVKSLEDLQYVEPGNFQAIGIASKLFTSKKWFLFQ